MLKSIKYCIYYQNIEKNKVEQYFIFNKLLIIRFQAKYF